MGVLVSNGLTLLEKVTTKKTMPALYNTLSECFETACKDIPSKYSLDEEQVSRELSPVSYGEKKTFHFDLITQKGNLAKCCFHLTVSRPPLGYLNAGYYQIENSYIL
jgi:hypothetical protein